VIFGYLAALRNPHVHILGHPRGRFTITGSVCTPIGRVFSTKLHG
jgi:hypothetical protein